eukprot:TRINITY_DN2150_c0_g1_i2.p1 TRINITY_DN2150_c0_g1~~TRINITY_DN2150_c0_g1_i2.p1  ORF type:complete len:359 (-),score=50.95 TRINITY_DN2150_c0_g1_i2:29-1105(-)
MDGSDVDALLGPICEDMPSTQEANVSKVDMDLPLFGVDYRNHSSLVEFCHPFVYTKIYLRLGSRATGNCGPTAITRGHDCEWYHMCVWPAEEDVYVSRQILEGGVWEEHLMFFMVNYLMHKPTGIVIDAGANIGQYSLVAAILGHRVIAFEPIPQHVEMMKKTFALNGISNRIHIYQNALADYSSKTHINFHKNNKGGSTIERIDTQGDETLSDTRFIPGFRIEIELIRLDEVRVLVNLLYPNLRIVFWKADIEGYEPRMFRGSSEIFDQFKPDVVMFEVLGKSFERTKCNLPNLLNGMLKLGYNMRTLEGALESKLLKADDIDVFSETVVKQKLHKDILLYTDECSNTIDGLWILTE